MIIINIKKKIESLLKYEINQSKRGAIDNNYGRQ